MTALEYANERDNVVVRFASNGAPAGEDIAWIPPETELPFDLSEIEGSLRADGSFEATNLNEQFPDWNGNLIYGLWLRQDASVWQGQYDELYAAE